MALGDPEGPEGECMVKDFLAFSQAIKMFEDAQVSKKMVSEDAADVLKTAYKFKVEGTPLSTEGNIWFSKALTAHRLRAWDELYQSIAKNLNTDPKDEAGKKVATKWRNLIAEHCMGAPEDYFLGIMLLIESANTKIQLEEQAKLPSGGEKLLTNAKILGDPMALDWILKALKSH